VGTGEALRSAIQLFDKSDMQSDAPSLDFRVHGGEES
jgi:hypothetical protein